MSVETTDDMLMWAILTRIANLGIAGTIPVPKTQLTGPITANAGTWTLPVGSTADFSQGQRVSLWDGSGCPWDWGTSGTPDYLPSGEKMYVISTKTSSSITVESLGLTGGYQFNHSVGAWVLANVGVELTIGEQDGLNTGFPVIRAATQDVDYSHNPGGRGAMTHNWTGDFNAAIQVITNLYPPEGSISIPVYSADQKELNRAVMRAIMADLRKHIKLDINGGPTVTSMNKPRVYTQPAPANASTVVFLSHAEISFIGKGSTF